MLLVLLKDKAERATGFPRNFSETDSTWMYEYRRVKSQQGKSVQSSEISDAESKSMDVDPVGGFAQDFLVPDVFKQPRDSSDRNRVYDADSARAGILKGKLVLLGPPLPNPPWWNKYSQLLRSKGITQEVVYRDETLLTDADVKYNEVMKSEIQRRFGAGILSQWLSEAKGE